MTYAKDFVVVLFKDASYYKRYVFDDFLYENWLDEPSQPRLISQCLVTLKFVIRVLVHMYLYVYSCRLVWSALE